MFYPVYSHVYPELSTFLLVLCLPQFIRVFICLPSMLTQFIHVLPRLPMFTTFYPRFIPFSHVYDRCLVLRFVTSRLIYLRIFKILKCCLFSTNLTDNQQKEPLIFQPDLLRQTCLLLWKDSDSVL